MSTNIFELEEKARQMESFPLPLYTAFSPSGKKKNKGISRQNRPAYTRFVVHSITFTANKQPIFSITRLVRFDGCNLFASNLLILCQLVTPIYKTHFSNINKDRGKRHTETPVCPLQQAYFLLRLRFHLHHQASVVYLADPRIYPQHALYDLQ